MEFDIPYAIMYVTVITVARNSIIIKSNYLLKPMQMILRDMICDQNKIRHEYNKQ